MQIIAQTLEDILGSLRNLEVDWRDYTAIQVIAQLQRIPVKTAYTIADVQALLEADFDEGVLMPHKVTPALGSQPIAPTAPDF